MHELGITRNIVSIAREHARGNRVRRVAVEIGKLVAVLPSAVRFCFDACCRDTELEGAALEIIETPAVYQCRKCFREITSDDFVLKCSCGSNRLEVKAGRELKVKELELA